MNKRSIRETVKEYTYIPENGKISDKVFYFRILFSFVTMIACIAAVVSSAFAYFNDEIASTDSTVVSAYYDLIVTPIDRQDTLSLNESELMTLNESGQYEYICEAVSDNKHKFILSASGTASTGYCKISVGDNVYYTDQIAQFISIEIEIEAAAETKIIFTPQWGTSSNYINGTTSVGTIADSTTSYSVYTVEKTARLSNVAEYYGVEEEDILLFNNMDMPTTLSLSESEQTDMVLPENVELRIPGVSTDHEVYKVPYSEYTVQPTATIEAISSHYQIPAEEILYFNSIESLTVGETLMIPNADPAISQYAVPFTQYTVEPTAKIADIANYYVDYGVTENDILVYNNIFINTEDVSIDQEEFTLTVGSVLNIPGVNEEICTYKVPFTTYIVEPAAKLSNIASHYGLSVSDLLYYNNLLIVSDSESGEAEFELLRGTTLRIPGATELTEPYSVPFVKYTIEPVAKLSEIALYYGVPEEDIVVFNEPMNFAEGVEIKIPNTDATKPQYSVPYAVYKVEPTAKLDNISKYYGIPKEDILTFNKITELTVGTDLKIPYADPLYAAYFVPYVDYVVEPTVTLSDLENYYKITAKDIFLYNDGSKEIFVCDLPFEIIDENYLNYVDVLFNADGTLIDENAVSLVQNVVLSIPGVDDVTNIYSVPYVIYVVEPTAKLSDIALYYGVSEDDILLFNGITELSVGYVLKIPDVDPLSYAYSNSYAVPYAYYTVEENATIEGISEYYGVSAYDILYYNVVTELPLVGTQIKIPGVSPDTIPYVAPPAETSEPDGSDQPDVPPVDDESQNQTDEGADNLDSSNQQIEGTDSDLTTNPSTESSDQGNQGALETPSETTDTPTEAPQETTETPSETTDTTTETPQDTTETPLETTDTITE